jgi:hypothetical protein
MTGDDLLPVLIFVTLKSRLEKPFSSLSFAVRFFFFAFFSLRLFDR